MDGSTAETRPGSGAAPPHQAPAPPAAATAPAAAPEAAPLPDARPAYTFRDMRLKVGDRAQLEPPAKAGNGRMPVRVVGWVENESLIVTVPHLSAGRLELLAGEMVLMRVFTGQSAFAFRCSVLKKYSPAFEYLQLSFPQRVDGVEVRSSPRVRIDLPAKVTLANGGGSSLDALIDNVGTTGALLEAAAPLGAKGDSLKVTFDLVLHEIPVSLSLDATIRTVHTDEASDGAPRSRHGVSFVEPGANNRLILAALVWFHMFENPNRAV